MIDLLEFLGFRFSRAGHTGQLLIETEVVLDRNGGVSLRFAFDLNVLFGFQGAVKSVAVTAARHDAAREFIDDKDLAFLHDVVHVFFKEHVRPHQLREIVQSFTGVMVNSLEGFFGRDFFFRGQTFVLVDLHGLLDRVGEDEFRLVFRRERRKAFVGQEDFVALFVHGEIEVLRDLVHFLALHVGDEVGMDLVQELVVFRIFHQFRQLMVLRVAAADDVH